MKIPSPFLSLSDLNGWLNRMDEEKGRRGLGSLEVWRRSRPPSTALAGIDTKRE